MPKHKPKVCVDCGNEFIPNSGVQKRCEPCRETHVVPSQTNEYRNAYRAKKRAGKPKKKKQTMPKMTISPADPTRGREPKTEREIERIGNTELGSRLRDRMNAIEQESYRRFQEERG